MVPTEEEKQRIQEAQMINPDVPLGSAESFLLTLSSISELCARLHLWAFKMDYETIEKVFVCVYLCVWWCCGGWDWILCVCLVDLDFGCFFIGIADDPCSKNSTELFPV